MGARAGDSTQLPDLCVLRSPSCSVPPRWSYSGPPRLSGEGTHWQASWSCTTCHPASHMTGEASPPIQCSASISQSRGKGAALCLVGNWGPCSDLRHWDRNAVPRLPPPTQSRNSGSSSCLFGGAGGWGAHFHSHFHPHLWFLSPLSKHLCASHSFLHVTFSFNP